LFYHETNNLKVIICQTKSTFSPLSAKAEIMTYRLSYSLLKAEVGQLQIKTESGERSDVITNRQIRDMVTLPSSGKNWVDKLQQ
jgi:hypothetical protein